MFDFRLGQRRASAARRRSAGLAGALALVAIRAYADEARPFSLSWTAPTDCPNGDAVRARVESLLGSTVEARLARPLEVKGTIVSAGGRAELHLETNDNGLPGSRTITGATCDELASAGALVIALAIDPAAVAAHGGVPSAAFNADAPTAPVNTTPTPVVQPPPPPPPAAPQPGPRSVPAESTNRVRGILGARALVDFGTVKSTPSFGAVFGAGFSMRRFLLRLDAKFIPPRNSDAAAARGKGADISLAAGSLSGCFVSRSGKLGIGACGAVETGVFLAEGTGLSSPNLTKNPWFAPGAGAELAVDLADPVCLLVGFGFLVPMGPEGRPTVQFTPAQGENPQYIFQPWPVVIRAGLGLGVALD